MGTAQPTVRLAAMADLHYGRDSRGLWREAIAAAAVETEGLLLCGDLTDHGLPEEAALLAEDLAGLRVPVVAVLGNHDFESDRTPEVLDLLRQAGVRVLDGEATVVGGVGVAGVKGFGGGFGRGTLGNFGEPVAKAYVQAALDEALKLERALASLRAPSTVAVLHYAPVAGTVEGEPLEIWPFLGSGRLEEPLVRYGVSVVVHGHAHTGAPEGRLGNGAPVFNVSPKVLRKLGGDAPPYRVLELPAPPDADAAGSAAGEGRT